MKPPLRPLLVLGFVTVGVLPMDAAAGAGASTFEGAARLYAPREFRPEDVVIPDVIVELPDDAVSIPDTSPEEAELEFTIERFEVSGNTLLTPTQIDDVLDPFTGPDKTLADVEAARDALQQKYAEEGLLTVGVALPQQTIALGIVNLTVVEARIGEINVDNEGVHWFSDELIRRLTPQLRPGEILRNQELREDIARVNRNPDRRVRPLLRSGAESGLVDLDLMVDDRIPLHASFTTDNDYTPGSPDLRSRFSISYGNLWGIEHEVSFGYQFVPTQDFNDVQVFIGTYKAPMPWNEQQSLLYYIVDSDTDSTATTAAGLNILGKGFNMGLRFDSPLPFVDDVTWYDHGITLGIDRKDIENTVVASNGEIVSPITYLPWSIFYRGSILLDNSVTFFRVGGRFNVAGTLPGGSTKDFQVNRGGTNPDGSVNQNSPVTGTYQIFVGDVNHTIRLGPLLRTLAAGHFVDLPIPTRDFNDDWTLNVVLRGQWASQPLISSEQFSAGGLDSVRGYLQGELFGDNGLGCQAEFRTPFFRDLLGGYASEAIQLYGFVDTAQLWTQTDPTQKGFRDWITSVGVGARVTLFDYLNAEFVLGRPVVATVDTPTSPRFSFRVSGGF